jgi:hypothetical protein
MSNRVDHGRFVALLRERFPEVAAQIDATSEGLLHMEMAALSRATQRAIDAQDREAVKRHFSFVDEVFRDGTTDVINAVNVSFLENLRFDGRKAGPTNARDLLPPRLRQALVALEEYLSKIHGGDGNR